jgi:hypothetical protein
LFFSTFENKLKNRNYDYRRKITTKKDDKEYELIYDKTILCQGV